MIRFLFILILPFYLFALSFVYPTTSNNYNQICKSSNSVDIANPKDFFINNSDYFEQQCNEGNFFNLIAFEGKTYIIKSNTDCFNTDSYNIACLQNNVIGEAGALESVSPYEGGGCVGNYSSLSYRAVVSDDTLEFCKNKENYFYDDKLNAWLPLNSGDEVICPDNLVWSSVQKKCVFDCSYDKMKILGAKKCGSENFIKSYTCDSLSGEYNITCYTCNEINTIVSKFCLGNNLKRKSGLVCSDVGGSVDTDFPFPDFTVDDVCEPDTNINVNDSSDSNISSNDNNTSGSNQNYNCCDYYNHQQGVWTLVNGCYQATINGIVCNISLNDGVCLSCVSNGSNSNNSDNSNFSDLSSKIDESNSKLSDINSKLGDISDTLEDVINMKPDDDVSFDGEISSEESSFISDYSEFVDNVVSDSYSLTLFENNDAISCPITTNIYGKDISLDICKFVYPYRPILQLFFTLFFNFFVVSFFIRVIIKRGEK